jgi:large subunit ribosomal protein L9
MLGQVDHLREDPTVSVAEEVGVLDELDGLVDRLGIQQDRPEHGALGFEIDKRKIQLAEPIKRVGEFSVAIKLHRDVVAHVPVKVTPLQDAPQE